MIQNDPRASPLIEITPAQIKLLLSPILGEQDIVDIKQVEGGLTNTIYCVTPSNNAPIALRLFAGTRENFLRECFLLTSLQDSLPVPNLLLADDSCGLFPVPYLAYQWIDGIHLNECRKRVTPSTLLSLAEPLGKLLARVAASSIEPGLFSPSDSMAELLSLNEERLFRGIARTRLGDSLSLALWRKLEQSAPLFEKLSPTNCLVHGDFLGRNLLVEETQSSWRIAGLIDWEASFLGWALWDVGNLFRYRGRYSLAFREDFERGYREAGGFLPNDWWRLSRLLDATRLVGTLNETRELPNVFEDCRELITAVTEDYL
jgi:aminoglycoside phosphotransferase (APT) family kinase protein